MQGDVFRRYNREDIERIFDKSQSLSSRAMSFDEAWDRELTEEDLSQSLSIRAMSFD